MAVSSHARRERIAALRETVRTIADGTVRTRNPLSFGLEAVDSRLGDHGLALAALHEVTAAQPGLADDAAATLFLAAIAARASRTKRNSPVLWALARRDLFAPGLALAGLGPERLIYAECSGDGDVLAVMEEGLRHGGLAAVVGEVGKAAMASTRRLQLAAEEKGITALLLRRWRKRGEDPLAAPSPAVTRWKIGCVPSEKLDVPGVSRARWRVALVRQRGGEPFEWILESPDAEGRLALPARPSYRPSAADRSEERRAA